MDLDSLRVNLERLSVEVKENKSRTITTSATDGAGKKKHKKVGLHRL